MLPNNTCVISHVYVLCCSHNWISVENVNYICNKELKCNVTGCMVGWVY
jgi:hypothetical protein